MYGFPPIYHEFESVKFSSSRCIVLGLLPSVDCPKALYRLSPLGSWCSDGRIMGHGAVRVKVPVFSGLGEG